MPWLQFMVNTKYARFNWFPENVFRKWKTGDKCKRKLPKKKKRKPKNCLQLFTKICSEMLNCKVFLYFWPKVECFLNAHIYIYNFFKNFYKSTIAQMWRYYLNEEGNQMHYLAMILYFSAIVYVCRFWGVPCLSEKK